MQALMSQRVTLQDKWSAVYSVQTILLSLQSLLGGAYITVMIHH